MSLIIGLKGATYPLSSRYPVLSQVQGTKAMQVHGKSCTLCMLTLILLTKLFSECAPTLRFFYLNYLSAAGQSKLCNTSVTNLCVMNATLLTLSATDISPY